MLEQPLWIWFDGHGDSKPIQSKKKRFQTSSKFVGCDLFISKGFEHLRNIFFNVLEKYRITYTEIVPTVLFVLNKLKEMGYKDFDHQKLFEVFYEDEEFSKKVYAEIEKDAGEEFKKLTEKKNELFKELDSLLVETYQTSSVLIDDTRLVAGEEGCLCTLDIEFIKNNNREGLFDPRKMSNTVKENILKKLDNLEEIIKF